MMGISAKAGFLCLLQPLWSKGAGSANSRAVREDDLIYFDTQPGFWMPALDSL